MEKNFDANVIHSQMLDRIRPSMSYTDDVDLPIWSLQSKLKLKSLLGMEWFIKVAPNLDIEYDRINGNVRERRFTFQTEENVYVPCYLLTPAGVKGRLPVMICVQGHSSGMHISLSRPNSKEDETEINENDRGYAAQILERGWAALVMEQRSFGERENELQVMNRCHHSAMQALMIGRTMVGERVWDVKRLIDAALDAFPELDKEKIGLMGDSGGGTTTYFAACLEKRISIAMPICYVCTFKDSIGSIGHCQCNYVPSITRYFEMGDMAVMIAPRKLVVVAGEQDPIFPIEATRKTCELIRRIYDKAGVSENFGYVEGPGGHRFYKALAWPVFEKLAGW